jgi:protein involved in polysaccharide export with SLBB domain
VSVANEPDLPKAYVVQSDGAIRFPLIGAIHVIGLTVEQARTTIGREFRERKINSAFDVSLRRPRDIRRVR